MRRVIPPTDELRLINPISQRQFELYALSLERGPNFGPVQMLRAYQAGRGSTSGCILLHPEQGTFSSLALRRRVDHRWIKVGEDGSCSTPEAAFERLSIAMRVGDTPEPLPPGAKRRPLLLKLGSRRNSAEFDLLTKTTSHLPALAAISECYLALPNPDANFVPDFQSSNFGSRLFELYLLACFREQGLSVRQDHASPDFLIEKDGDVCWIEAVTANSQIPAGGIGNWVNAPEDRNERLTGAPAERFAKTLRGKLQRNYHEMDHVRGQSFALALADFHQSGSMVWSREALPTYLYGLRTDVQGKAAARRAVATPIANLTGKHGIQRDSFAMRSSPICPPSSSAKRRRSPNSTGWAFLQAAGRQV